MSNKELQRLPLMEHFYTIQGEGAYTGHAAYFLRLGGCNVGCVWCDVKDSWDANAHPQVSVEHLTTLVKENSESKLVVITGGEPAMYNLHSLTDKLQSSGYQTHIETSGAYPIQGTFDWITLSPKKFKAPVTSAMDKANELKVVIYNKSDFAWAEEHAKQVNKSCKLFLQPEWSKHEKMQLLIFEYVKENPQWQISLQTHKYLGVD